MTYYGDTHIFTNQTNQANITIKAGKNENLIIENPTLTGIVNASIGANKQVIYNNNGLLSGSSKMSFDGSVFYSQDSISTGSLDGSVSSDSVGYNQIYQGTGPQSVVTTQISDLDDVGTDVSMARNVNRVAFAAPKSGDGGSSIWTKGASIFEEYTEGVVSYKTALTSPNLKFSSFDEDAIILVVFAGDTTGTITTWDCGSETFVDISTQSFGLSAGKISEDRMLAYDYNSNFKCYQLVGDDWVLKQTLLTNGLPISYSLDYAITISGTKLAFSYGSATYVYNFDFVSWSLISTIPFGAISLDYYSGVLAHVTTGDLRIYENFNLVATFNVANLLHTCTNGTYVFTITSTGVIRIYSKVSGVWTMSVNTYNAGSDSKKMSCNSGYLAVGRPSVAPRGEGYIFQIQTYTNGPIIVNTLDLVNNTSQIDITAAAGVKFSTSTESSSITTGSVQLLGGLGVSKTIFATKYSSANGAFKHAKWIRNTNQAYTSPALANILYNSQVLNEITALSYNSGTGVFTVNSATRLFVAAFTRYFSAQNLSTILRNTTSSINLFAVTNTDSLYSNPGISMSCVIDLAANTSFSVQVFASTSNNVIGSATNNETFISFYSLN